MFEAESPARFDALLVSDVSADDVELAVRLNGGRLVGCVGWNEAFDHIEMLSGQPLILLDARLADEGDLAATLHLLDEAAFGRDLSVIAGITERQIDVVAAGLVRARHEILCDPGAADWAGPIALAHVSRGLVLHDRVAESEAARLARLNAEVARIADVLARLANRELTHPGENVGDVARSFLSEPFDGVAVAAGDIRQIIRARRLRDRFFGAGLFEDPGWDMMLDLYAAHLEEAQVSVSSLCIAAAVAPTTALRWISKMTEIGLLVRKPDPFDRRRAFMSLSDHGLEAMGRYVGTARAIGLPLV